MLHTKFCEYVTMRDFVNDVRSPGITAWSCFVLHVYINPLGYTLSPMFCVYDDTFVAFIKKICSSLL